MKHATIHAENTQRHNKEVKSSIPVEIGLSGWNTVTSYWSRTTVDVKAEGASDFKLN